MIPPYGQQKLTRYAETFKELAEMMACEEDKPALYEVQRVDSNFFKDWASAYFIAFGITLPLPIF